MTRTDRGADTGAGAGLSAGTGAGAVDAADGVEGAEGSDGLDGETADTPWVEVYNTSNEFAAQAASAEVLEAHDIPSIQHDRRSHSISAPAAMMGEIGLAVPEHRAREARELLREALRDGAILDGEVIEEDDEEGEAVV